jgi:uncharacterized membrane protein
MEFKADQENKKLQKDIEEIKKQIWLLTLRVKNLKDSTKKMKREFLSNSSSYQNVSDKLTLEDEIEIEKMFKDLS